MPTIALPPSPFGPAAPLDLSGLRFGALMRGQDKQTPVLGFFMEPEALGRAISLYAEAVPGAGLREAFLAVGAPPAIRGLFEEWREDWRQRWAGHRPTPSNGLRASDARFEANPYASLEARERPPVEERFAWILGYMSAPGLYEERMADARAEAMALWRAELESRGIACCDWIGRSLTAIGNGHSSSELMADARAEAEASMLRVELARDLDQTLAPGRSGGPGRI